MVGLLLGILLSGDLWAAGRFNPGKYKEVKPQDLGRNPENYKGEEIFLEKCCFGHLMDRFPDYFEKNHIKPDKYYCLRMFDFEHVPVLLKKKSDMAEIVRKLKTRAIIKIYGEVEKFKKLPKRGEIFAKYYLDLDHIEVVQSAEERLKEYEDKFKSRLQEIEKIRKIKEAVDKKCRLEKYAEVKPDALEKDAEYYTKEKIVLSATLDGLVPSFPVYFEKNGFKPEKYFQLRIDPRNVPVFIKKESGLDVIVGKLQHRHKVKLYGKLKEFRRLPKKGRIPAKYYIEADFIECPETSPERLKEQEDQCKRELEGIERIKERHKAR